MPEEPAEKQPKKRRRRPKPKTPSRAAAYLWLGPRTVLDIAYSVFVADRARLRPESEWSYSDRLAIEAANDFVAFCGQVKPDSQEGQLVMIIQLTVVSLARGISRRRTSWEEAKKAAADEKDQEIREISDTSRRSGLIRAVLKASLVGGFGYALMHTFLPFLSLGEETKSGSASATFGIGLVLLSSFVRSWVTHHKVTRVFRLYDYKISCAHLAYQEGVAQEYALAKKNARDAWDLYLGEVPPDGDGFEKILLSDIDDLRQAHTTYSQLNTPLSVKITASFNQVLNQAKKVKTRWDERRKADRRKGESKVNEGTP